MQTRRKGQPCVALTLQPRLCAALNKEIFDSGLNSNSRLLLCRRPYPKKSADPFESAVGFKKYLSFFKKSSRRNLALGEKTKKCHTFLANVTMEIRMQVCFSFLKDQADQNLAVRNVLILNCQNKFKFCVVISAVYLEDEEFRNL